MVAIGFAALGCKREAPADHTSLALDPGSDPGKPAKTLSMVWLHHSTGDVLLEGGLLQALKGNNIDFYDINYKEAVVNSYVIGDHTDVPDWPKTFNDAKRFDVVRKWELPQGEEHHDVVMFKSCFPNSNIDSEAKLEEYKKHFNALIPTFQANPEILFIGMSTPPLVKAQTNPEAASRARQWAKWLNTSYAKDVKNIKIFDLFNALAIAEGKPDENTLVPQFAMNKEDSHPTAEGARAVARLFIPWFNRSVREAGFAQ